MIYAVISPKKKTLTFCRAGHNSLLIKDSRTCTVDRRVPEGIGLGLESGELFKENIHEETIRLNRNHTILFYTDGITEAKNEQGEEYGENRLVDLMKSLDSKSAAEINEAVVASVCGHTHQNISHDDMTLVTITAV
jgi:sigma-B regulation protein RsbU (phosphoserine phosphatase)